VEGQKGNEIRNNSLDDRAGGEESGRGGVEREDRGG